MNADLTLLAVGWLLAVFVFALFEFFHAYLERSARISAARSRVHVYGRLLAVPAPSLLALPL